MFFKDVKPYYRQKKLLCTIYSTLTHFFFPFHPFTQFQSNSPTQSYSSYIHFDHRTDRNGNVARVYRSFSSHPTISDTCWSQLDWCTSRLMKRASETFWRTWWRCAEESSIPCVVSSWGGIHFYFYRSCYEWCQYFTVRVCWMLLFFYSAFSFYYFLKVLSLFLLLFFI